MTLEDGSSDILHFLHYHSRQVLDDMSIPKFEVFAIDVRGNHVRVVAPIAAAIVDIAALLVAGRRCQVLVYPP